ncbi:hypothetical protein BH20CHL2_BH20CHL2_01900 [soil metagenome]
MARSPLFGNGSAGQKVAAVALVVVITLLVGGSILYSALRDTTPGENSAEAGFLRDMQVHHTQAVIMADTIRFRTEDDQIMAMATDIAFAQMSQIGTMSGFLQLWDLNPTGDERAMAWMGHPTTGLMPGMATDEEIDQLQTLPVEEAEVLFLQLMNRHHFAGVEMAEAVLERSDQEDVALLAEGMMRVQDAEIEVMNILLTQRGEEPVTTVDAEIHARAEPAATPTDEDHDH